MKKIKINKQEKKKEKKKKVTSNVKRCNKCKKLHRGKWEIIGVCNAKYIDV